MISVSLYRKIFCVISDYFYRQIFGDFADDFRQIGRGSPRMRTEGFGRGWTRRGEFPMRHDQGEVFFNIRNPVHANGGSGVIQGSWLVIVAWNIFSKKNLNCIACNSLLVCCIDAPRNVNAPSIHGPTTMASLFLSSDWIE